MRVMHVMAGAREGGAETIMLDSVLALARAGVEQAVVTRPGNSFRLDALRTAGVQTATAGFSRLWPFPTRAAIAAMIRRFRPDVIEYWMGRAGEFAPAAERARSIGWYGGYYALKRFSNCAWHVGLTRDLVRHVRDAGVAEDRIGLIHTYADFTDAAPIDRASLATPQEAPVALALARLHWKKGLDTLLDATARTPGLHLWIAGEGPLEADLKAQSARLGLDDRVRFLGWRNDRGALLAASTFVAFPSRYEPFGTVMVDAWAAGRAIVAADAAGPAAYIRDGVNGLLIPRDDVDALASALQRLSADEALRFRLAAGGRATYEASFTEAAFVRDSLAFYRRVAAAGGA